MRTLMGAGGLISGFRLIPVAALPLIPFRIAAAKLRSRHLSSRSRESPSMLLAAACTDTGKEAGRISMPGPASSPLSRPARRDQARGGFS